MSGAMGFVPRDVFAAGAELAEHWTLPLVDGHVLAVDLREAPFDEAARIGGVADDDLATEVVSSAACVVATVLLQRHHDITVTLQPTADGFIVRRAGGGG